MTITELGERSTQELAKIAQELKITGARKYKKRELIVEILKTEAERNGFKLVRGILEIMPEGYGFLRTQGYTPDPTDVYVATSQIQRFSLRSGDMVLGEVRPPKDSERYYGLLKIVAVNDQEPEKMRSRATFEKLTPLFPNERFTLERDPKEISTRIIDLIAPIGKGQRALIVSPPKAGKTILLKKIATSIAQNHEGVHILVLLVDERPEEVTDMQRSVEGEVAYSTFDRPPENHTRVAELVLERAKRLVECKEDVVILLDSITRLARAYNLVCPPSGRTLSGGIDPNALHKPKRFFGAARNIEEGGSVTIVATALIDTGSRMDEVIYEEFKGTGNMELHLDRSLAEKRIFPAIDIKRSGTRHEELLYGEDLRKIWVLRRVLAGLETQQATELIIDRLSNVPTNKDFLNNKDFSRSAAKVPEPT